MGTNKHELRRYGKKLEGLKAGKLEGLKLKNLFSVFAYELKNLTVHA